jgi:succinate-semialdehyde dehydrogenase / glutarate-semialdehyde dehydrogenase
VTDSAEAAELYLDGHWRVPVVAERFAVTSPATGGQLWDLAEAGPADVDAAVSAARTAFGRYQGISPHERAAWCEHIADKVEASSELIAREISLEQGKPLADGSGEVGLAAEGFKLAAQETRALRGETIPAHDVPQRRSGAASADQQGDR